MKLGYIKDVTDENEINDHNLATGIYSIPYVIVFSIDNEAGRKFLFNIKFNKYYSIQLYINSTTNKTFIRVYHDGAFDNWHLYHKLDYITDYYALLNNIFDSITNNNYLFYKQGMILNIFTATENTLSVNKMLNSDAIAATNYDPDAVAASDVSLDVNPGDKIKINMKARLIHDINNILNKINCCYYIKYSNNSDLSRILLTEEETIITVPNNAEKIIPAINYINNSHPTTKDTLIVYYTVSIENYIETDEWPKNINGTIKKKIANDATGNYLNPALNITTINVEENTIYMLNGVCDFTVDNQEDEETNVIIRYYRNYKSGLRTNTAQNSPYDITIFSAKDLSSFELAVVPHLKTTPQSDVNFTINYNFTITKLTIQEYSKIINSNPTNLKVCSWNTGMIEFGHSGQHPNFMNEKIELLKKFLIEENFDILCVQEDSTTKTLNDGSTIDMLQEVYKPLFNNIYSGNFMLHIYSKYPIIHTETGWFTDAYNDNKRGWAKVVILVDETLVCLFNCHLAWQPEAVETRAAQKLEIFNSLVKDYDNAILFGDWNGNSEEEFNIFKENGYALCNGGYFAFQNTHSAIEQTIPLDNIIFKGNIFGARYKVYEPYRFKIDTTGKPSTNEEDYYISDHLPISAKLTLF